MADALLRRESAIEFFKGLVDDAIARQRIKAAEMTSCYVVNLLAGFLQRPAGDDMPIGPRLVQALERGGVQRRAELREIADLSLFMSGFFSDSFARKPVDVDYYIAIGGSAYGALSRFDTDTLSPVFGELARKFVGFVDVLSEVSERTSCSSNTDLLRLYQKWLKTGSPLSGQILVARGLVPGPGSGRVQ
jgi:hypothetical protein